jgi:hypothetical protein
MVALPLPDYGVRPRWPVDWTRAAVLLTKHRWLLLFTMLFALGWTAAAVLTMQKQCSTTNDCLLLEDGGGCLLAENGRPLLIGSQSKQCDLVFGDIRIPLPTL